MWLKLNAAQTAQETQHSNVEEMVLLVSMNRIVGEKYFCLEKGLLILQTQAANSWILDRLEFMVKFMWIYL